MQSLFATIRRVSFSLATLWQRPLALVLYDSDRSRGYLPAAPAFRPWRMLMMGRV